MVLVAPHPQVRHPTPGIAPRNRGGGRDVLALLRGETAARPQFDPQLRGGLRAWLEDAAYGLVAGRGEHAEPLFLGPRQLLGSPGEWRDGDDVSDELLLSHLVHALFRHLVSGGDVTDALPTALAALGAVGAHAVVDRIESLTVEARAALADTLSAQAGHLADMVPRFAPGWLPRTDDRVAIPLAGGRVVLHGTFDLLVGLPHPGTASLCAIGLSTSGARARERRTLHYLALLETLRSGSPPFRLALLESATGRYGVEDVREEHLRAIASHLSAWLSGGAEPGA